MRTKQQVACDGIKTSWHSDAFTEILHQQVTTQFSIDGVIPRDIPQQKGMTVRLEKRAQKTETTQKPAMELWGAIEGVRLPWKKAYKTV